MKLWHKFLIGGLGALVPVLLNLLVIDLEALQLEYKPLVAASYGLRVLGLFIVGGIVVTFFNRDEKVPAKIFQLGIAAPALLTALINGNNVSVPRVAQAAAAAPPAAAPAASTVAWRWPDLTELLPSAHAQPAASARVPAALVPKVFTLPEETARQQVARGLWGAAPKNIWFVVAGSHLDKSDAEQQALQLRRKNFDADVYLPYGDNPYYAVVIGAQLTQRDASALRSRAVVAGLPADTYLWTFPR
jgi:hypothetical protein